MKSGYWLILIIIIIIIGFSLFFQGNSQNNSNLTAQNNTSMKNKDTDIKPTQSLQIDKSKKYTAILSTGKGNITIALTADKTPITVNNFVTLAKKNFYNNTIFHRVMKGFMIQGGDPKGDGTGGPGYKFDDELFDGDYTRGTVAMANSGPDTNGSQFFIMHQDYQLPKNYVIFGKIIKGIEVVDTIANSPVNENTMGEKSTPINPVKVLSVDIKEE